MLETSGSQPSNAGLTRLKEVRPTLDELHKLLLQAEKESYENVFGKITSPGVFLNLLLKDPWFAWLRSLSGLMANIDETLDAKEPATEEQAQVLIKETLSLLTPSEEGIGFPKEYFNALQRDPDVVMTHAAILKIIRG
jgi:hypothetical protein